MKGKTDEELVLKVINEISNEIVLNRESISKILDFGLFSGNTGIALFMFKMYEFTRNEEHKNAASFFLENSFEEINKGSILPTFCNGIAGFAWTVNYLVEHSLIEENNIRILNEFDDYLYISMIAHLKADNFDFLHGATGIAFYFTCRVNHNMKVKGYLKEYTDYLKKYSIYDSDTESLKIVSTTANKKVYNLGMAHGVSSIIVVLSKISQIDRDNSDTEFLIKGFSNYILINENINMYRNGSMYPTSVYVNKNDEPENRHGSRLGWCYGDMGNGLALYHAYKALGIKKYYNKSFEIFINCSKRNNAVEQSICDAGMCHGSAGISNIFQTVSDYFLDEKLKKAENHWVSITLDYYKNGNGLKGFSKYSSEGYEYVHNLLQGTIGIGLSLLSHLTEEQADWSELFLSK